MTLQPEPRIVRPAWVAWALGISVGFYELFMLAGFPAHQWAGWFLVPPAILIGVLVTTQSFPRLDERFVRGAFLSLTVMQTLGWLVLIVVEYYAITYNILDTGYYAQVVCSLRDGNGFLSSVMQRPAWAVHFTPILYLFVPLYMLKTSILWLPLVRLAAYLAGLLLWWLISGHYLADKRLRYLVLILWLVCLPITKVLCFEFHPSSLVFFFLPLAILLALRKRVPLFIVGLVFLLTLKEQMALCWVSLGVWLVLQKKRVAGVSLVVSGIAAGLVIVFAVTPYLSHGIPNAQLGRFGLTAQPLEKINFIFLLLVSVGFIPVLRPRTLLYVIPATALTLVSSFSNMTTFDYHYQDLPVTMLFLALIEGLSAWEKKEGWFFRLPGRWQRGLVSLGMVMVIGFNNYFPMRQIRKAGPTAKTIAVVHELEELSASLDRSATVWTLDSLGVYFLDAPNLRSIYDIHEPLSDPSERYIVLSDQASAWPIKKDYSELRAELEREVAGGRMERLRADVVIVYHAPRKERLRVEAHDLVPEEIRQLQQ